MDSDPIYAIVCEEPDVPAATTAQRDGVAGRDTSPNTRPTGPLTPRIREKGSARMEPIPSPSSERALCRDISGRIHLVPVEMLIDRTSVYGLAFRPGGALLVKDRQGGGDWELPGGGVEDGESHLDALGRELHEETGMTLAGEPRLLCHVEEYFFEREREEAWRSRRYFYLIAAQGTLREGGNGDDIERAAVLPWIDEDVATMTLAVIQEALDQSQARDKSRPAPDFAEAPREPEDRF